eukprot:Hpha_TRINITY_DN16320_c2_g4::TRINITY_DN16320_c2_g4_i1::g.59945::m.59945
MPGIARLVDGTLVVVFEGFWASGKWGHFSVQMRRSFDGGATWNKGEVIFSAGANNAGAPQVAVSPSDGRVVVSFMTDEDAPDKWPADASSKFIYSAPNAGKGFTFDSANKKTVCGGPGCMWPGVFNSGGATWYEYEHGG